MIADLCAQIAYVWACEWMSWWCRLESMRQWCWRKQNQCLHDSMW
jgi:hypothetical protein